MTTSRREFIVGTGAAIALANLPARAAERRRCRGRKAAGGVRRRAAGRLSGERDRSGHRQRRRAALKAKLADRSAAGQQAIAQRVAKRLERLKAIDTARLGEAARIDVDVMRTAHEFAAEGFAFPYGDVGAAQFELVVSQRALRRRAEHRRVPRNPRACWTSSTPWRRAQDADAYLSRLEAYAGQLDGETGRLQAAAAQGVIAPDFLLDKTLAQIKIARGGNIADWSLVHVARDSGRRTCRATSPRRRRRLRRTKSRRRSTARSPSWKHIASAQPAMPACGSCRTAMRTTRGR